MEERVKQYPYIVLLFIGALFSATSGTAASTNGGIGITEKGVARHWKKLPVTLCLEAKMPESAKKAIKSAARVWNDSFPAKIFDLTCESKARLERLEDEHEHVIFWVKGGFDKYAGKTVLARTLTAFDEDGRYVDADVVINAEHFIWDGKAGSKLDLESVMVHELGHVLGLQHFDISTETALKSYPYQSGVKFRHLGGYEKLAIRRHYFRDQTVFPVYIDKYFGGKIDEAIALLEKAEGSQGDLLYQLAMLQLLKKNVKAAAVLLERHLKTNPNDVYGIYQLGDVYWVMDRVADAKAMFERVLKLNPDYYEALMALGVIARDSGNLKDAIALMKQVLMLNPVHYLACQHLFEVTKEKKYLDCVKKYADEAN